MTARSVRDWEHGRVVPKYTYELRQRLVELREEHAKGWDARSLSWKNMNEYRRRET